MSSAVGDCEIEHVGFDHLDLDLSAVPLRNSYHLGERADAADTYLLHYVSVRTNIRDGWVRLEGSFYYALHRDYWERVYQPTITDQAKLRKLAHAEVPGDLAALERGDDVPWFKREDAASLPEPKFLS